jgi:uncharacterized protein YebE (UPF0316 family)
LNLQSLPNTLTIGRIIAVPLFVVLFYWGGPWGDPLAALVFILAVSAVLKGPLTVGNVLGYSLGFGAGVMLGIYFEERLAIGHSMFRIYSPAYGHAIAEALRTAGHAATEFPAIGRDGTLIVVNCAVSRRNASAVRAVIEGVDPGAFVTVDEVRPTQRGYFRH